jgi:hypothetical protein
MTRLFWMILLILKFSHQCPYLSEAKGDLIQTEEKATGRQRWDWCGHKEMARECQQAPGAPGLPVQMWPYLCLHLSFWSLGL